MKKKKRESDDDLFTAFLIKEQELNYAEKRHAQAAIRKMARDFQESENQRTFKSKITDFFCDHIECYRLSKLKRKSERKINKLSKEDKCDKELEHKIYKHNDFQLHIFLERKLIDKTLIADCGGFIIPTIEYNVFLRIEYIPAELWTQKHFKSSYSNYDDALENFSKLKSKYKDKTGQAMINYLTEKIDKHCDILNQKIKYYNYN